MNVQDLGSIQLAYAQHPHDLKAHTGQLTYAPFGAWQTERELGFVAFTQNEQGTDVHISTEQPGQRDIQTELTDRVEQVIERSQTQQPEPAAEHDRQHAWEHDIDRDRDNGRGFGIE